MGQACGRVRAGGDEISSRVVKTYDFLRIKDAAGSGRRDRRDDAVRGRRSRQLKPVRDGAAPQPAAGRSIDWDLLEPLLRVSHAPERCTSRRSFDVARHARRGHPGGELAGRRRGDAAARSRCSASARTSSSTICASCPTIRRTRPTSSRSSPRCSSSGYLNAHKNLMVIHGVNLSLSVPHDVANYACGRTPVCEECERVVASGVVVVTAAGNRGFDKRRAPRRPRTATTATSASPIRATPTA